MPPSPNAWIDIVMDISDSPAFLAETKKLPAVARHKAGVLFGGETETGEEICARAIHRLSPRAEKPVIALNCGATPVELLDIHLFSHDAEAFTSAVSSNGRLTRFAPRSASHRNSEVE
jgi:transcriptional regulator with GAF, ATPase, and Fis domain